MSSDNFIEDSLVHIKFRPLTRGEYNRILVCKTSSPEYDKHNGSLYWEEMKLVDDNKPYYVQDLTYDQGKFSNDWEKAIVMYGDTLRNFLKDEELILKVKQWMYYIITEESSHIISKAIGTHRFNHNLYRDARLQPVLKSKKAKEHFGDILTGLNFNEQYRSILESFHSYTPSVQDVQSFKLTPKEQKLVDIIVHVARAVQGYHVNREVDNFLENKTEIFDVIRNLFLKYIPQIAGNFSFDEDERDYNEDHAIKNLLRSEIMQPYMNSDVLYNLVYDTPEIDVNDLEGLISSGVRRKGQEAKEYVGKNTSGKINTTLYLFMFYKHKPETIRKVVEVFVKYAILANFKNTDYMFERSLKPKTQEHFGDLIGNL